MRVDATGFHHCSPCCVTYTSFIHRQDGDSDSEGSGDEASEDDDDSDEEAEEDEDEEEEEDEEDDALHAAEQQDEQDDAVERQLIEAVLLAADGAEGVTTPLCAWPG